MKVATRTLRAAVAFAAVSLVSLSPVFAGSWSKTAGDSKFGVFLALDYDFNIDSAGKTDKSYVSAKPNAGAKLFSKSIQVIASDLVVGNYGSYYQDKWYKPPSVDLNKVKDWRYYADLSLFGIILWSKSNTTVPENPSNEGTSKWFKKAMPTIPIPVGPVQITISYGVTTSTSVTPKPSLYKVGGQIRGAKVLASPSFSMDAFAEGAVSAYVLRGGIGASLNLFTGSAGLDAIVDLVGKSFKIDGVLSLSTLKGKVYAFVDRISISCCFKKKWKRMLDVTITSWNGFSWKFTQPLWSKTW